MTRKKRSIIKAYKRKWRRMPREDRIFVIKFLGCAFLILLLVIALFSFLIFKLTHLDQKTDKNKSITAKYVSASLPNTFAAILSASDIANASSGNADTSSGTEADLEASASADNDDILLLASLIYAEAGNASRETQIAVASVIMNRVQSDKYPDTISGVIYQEGQYPPASAGALDSEPEEQALAVARYVYQNGSQIPSNVLYQSKSPQGSGTWAVLDGEYFCYE